MTATNSLDRKATKILLIVWLIDTSLLVNQARHLQTYVQVYNTIREELNYNVIKDQNIDFKNLKLNKLKKASIYKSNA